MILLDTSYVLALVNPRDQWHSLAMAWSKAVAERLLTTEYILWESVNFLSSPADRSKAKAVAEYLRTDAAIEFIAAMPHLLDDGLRLHAARRNKAWSLTDCISFEVMRQRGLKKALSADHHFTQAGFDAMLLREPP